MTYHGLLLSPTSIYLVENILVFYCETGLVNKRGLSVRPYCIVIQD